MTGRSILVLFWAMTLGLIGSASAATMVGWWPLDEVSGTATRDASGRGNNGIVVGAPVWSSGKFGGALQLDGSTYVNCGASQVFNVTDAVTLAAWIQPDPAFAYPDWSGIIMRGGANIDTFALYYNGPNKQLGFKTTGTTPNWFASVANSAASMFDREWHHVAATYDGARKILYLDGAPLASVAATGRIETSSGRLLLGAGRDLTPATHYAVGKLDDAVIYDNALTEAEIRRVMAGLADKSLARDPDPEDGAVDVLSDVILGWIPGQYAVTHDVYVGTSFTDVNSASRANPRGVLVAQGLASTQFQTAGLDYGQVYYWRVDEVNAAPDNTIFKGDVWSFTTEPYSYPIGTVTATASGSSRADTGPVNTVNGSGLNAGDQHSVEVTHMWLSDEASPKWIQYEFDKAYKVDQLWVWNANQMIEAFVGFSAKNVTIEYSLDGQTWTALEGVPEFSRGGGVPTYAANTVVDFGGIEAKFVRLTINSNWGGVAKQVSLSEVRFYYVPVQARSPVPADGAKDVGLDAQMNWRPGREATSHQVFFGADEAAVAAGTAPSATVTGHSYTPASMTFGTRYFWRVDEIGGDGPYEGPVWNFTTQEFALIEDFEAYTDEEGSRIYEYWLDGIADTVYGGSMVGYMEAPFAERVIVRGGRQSMPLAYDNTKAPYFSEAVREFDSVQNWTGSGAGELCVWTRGTVTEAGLAPMYVIVTDSTGKSATAISDTAATVAAWTRWTIPMSSLPGVNFSRVKKLTIGVGSKGAASGGSGVVFIDDIGYGRTWQ